MLKNIVLVLTISLISIMSYRFITEKHEGNIKTQKSELKNNDSIQQDKIDTKTNTIAIQKHIKKVSKTTNKKLPLLDTSSNTVEKKEIFVDYLTDKTAKEIMDDPSLTQKEKDVMIMDKMYFDSQKDDSSAPLTEAEIETLMEEDMDYQISNK